MLLDSRRDDMKRGNTWDKKERNKWCHNKQQSLDRMNCLCFYQSAEGEYY